MAKDEAQIKLLLRCSAIADPDALISVCKIVILSSANLSWDMLVSFLNVSNFKYQWDAE